MSNLPVIGWDTETHPIGAGAVAPRAVCVSVASEVDGSLVTGLKGRGEEAEMHNLLDYILSGRCLSAAMGASYDLAVVAADFPDRIPQIYKGFEAGTLSCIRVREKLLDLAEYGDLEWYILPDGGKRPKDYKLSSMVLRHFGVDITDSKTGDEVWRLNYHKLDGVPVGQWPPEAAKYAIDDAVWVVRIHAVQEQRRAALTQRLGLDPLKTEGFQVASDFALQLVSCWGISVDRDEVLRIASLIEADVSPEAMKLLYDHGILRPAVAPKPHANGAKAHVEGCKKKWVEDRNGAKVTIECNCPVKMSGGSPETMNKAKLQSYVEALAAANPLVTIKKTSPSTKFPEGQISVDGEWLDDHAHLDPVLATLQRRAEVSKMISTEIPRMMQKDEKGNPIPGCPAPVVHPRFDVLKETGRTSSYADGLYPSINVQNVDPRARGVYVPRDGFVLVSIDFSQMELCTWAQRCYELFGYSKLREIINAGQDPHAWLGAQIALAADRGFNEWCRTHNVNDRNDVYHAFSMLHESIEKEQRDFYKHYRKLAKPTGLGYPGGLGAETFVAYAKATYGVVIDIETAKMLREVWKSAIEEAEMYFDWIKKSCGDPHHPKIEMKDKTTGGMRLVDGFAYTSPLGMHRAACVYCAAANGIGLQTPGAEGAKMALVNVVRAMYDPTMQSILCDGPGVYARVLGFIHDELLCEIREDAMLVPRAEEIRRIMVAAMKVITPDVSIRANIAMMRKWNKDAEPAYDASGKLTIWEPRDSNKV